jgi:hypothetical protein
MSAPSPIGRACAGRELRKHDESGMTTHRFSHRAAVSSPGGCLQGCFSTTMLLGGISHGGPTWIP